MKQVEAVYAPDSEVTSCCSGDAACCREGLMHDSGCAIATLDADGSVLSCNSAFGALEERCSDPGDDGPQPVGPRESLSAAAHSKAREVAFGSGGPVTIDGTIAGHRSVATYRRFTTPDGPRLLLVVARWHPEARFPDDAEVISLEPGPNDRLASLTPREVDVLRCIAAGMSTAETAKHLHRSVKTIEGHRVSLGVKLNVRNRVQLAQIAWLWGLAPVADSETKPAD